MTKHQMKKDAAQRLAKAGVKYDRLTGRTVSFMDLARVAPFFVHVINPVTPPGWNAESWKAMHGDIPKPSEGGYIITFTQP